MKLLKLAAFSLTLLAVAMPAAFAQAPDTPSEEAQVKAYVEMLRKDIRKDSNAVVDQAMELDPAQKAKFWGIYDGYQKEMKSLWDSRLANIKKYAEAYPNVSDALADQLAAASLNSEAQQTAIRKKYHAQMKAALGSKSAARFLQVENMLAMIIGLQLVAVIHLLK